MTADHTRRRRRSALASLVLAVAAGLLVAPPHAGSRAAAPADVVVVRHADGRAVGATVDATALARVLVDVPGTAPAPPRLACRDARGGPATRLALSPLAARHADGRVRFSVALDAVWSAFPHPIDPTRIPSKATAIITQTHGISPFLMASADLREAYADVAAYLLVTAGHRHAVPYGDGALACRVTAAGAASRWLTVVFGRGAPPGPFPRDRSRPPRDGWPTWLDGGGAPDHAGAVSPERTSAAVAGADAAPLAEVRRWDDGSAVGPWIARTLDAVAVGAPSAVRGARTLALVSAAMHDALDVAAGLDAVCEQAAVGGAAATVLAGLDPSAAEAHERALAKAVRACDALGDRGPGAVAGGLAAGRWAGRQALRRLAADGERGTPTPPDDATWRPAPPSFEPPLDPEAARWRPWNLDAPSALRPPAPPAAGGPAFAREVTEVVALRRDLDLDGQQLASGWEDKAGTAGPPGHWNLLALQAVREEGWSTDHAALLFAVLNTVQADALIAAWDAKYTYWTARPVTVIRDGGDTDWSPYVLTPPFPSYVSGHATTSAAAAEVLARAFPARAERYRALAAAAAESRIVGGIHYRSDNSAGAALGRAVAAVGLGRVPADAWPTGDGRGRT